MKVLKFKCLFLVAFLFLIRPAFAVTYIDYGVADVRVYVVMLDGVDAHGVNNVSRAVKGVLEVGSNIVIVNIHGETIPIPRGYSEEGWIDKIAEAMIYRNVTWVHTVGYPFYYYQSQSGEWAEWGEEGFKRLMAHMGKENVTCHPPDDEHNKVYLSLDTEYSIMNDWPGVALAFYAERGKPLNASMFRDCSLFPIWGTPDGYLTGAIIRFRPLHPHRHA